MKQKKPLIGVTGIIGSGKSTVANLFGELGGAVFNSDATAKEVTQDSKTLQEIQRQFGPGILDSSGQLNRREMARVVFQNPDQLKKLNRIIHPKVRNRMWTFVEQKQNKAPVTMIVVDSPLIYETDLHHYLDFIVVITASEEKCIERVKKRNNLSRNEIVERMSQQIPLEIKIKKADFIIKNDKNIDDLTVQVREIYRQILSQWSKNP